MGGRGSEEGRAGKGLALAAALLGWMFDGLEMGLFPLVARPALRDLLGPTGEADITLWYAVATAGFLVGAATGGVLFGWLGDRLGRVRAMVLSVLTYAVFSGLCAGASAAWQVAVLRFVSALGMGGEWSLGVALVMELWPNRSRAWLAALIGAAGNAGYLLIALLGLGLDATLGAVCEGLARAGLPESWVAALAAHSAWRLLMLLGAVPAFLTLFIRWFVPESERWRQEQGKGTTSHWAARDLVGVLIGTLGAGALIALRVARFGPEVQFAGAGLGLVLILLGYSYPVVRYLQRSAAAGGPAAAPWAPTVRRMLLGACLGGVALLGTWGSVQWAPVLADQLTNGALPQAKAYTQTWSAFGAMVGTVAGALLGAWAGRRPAYALLCLASLGSVLFLFLGPARYDSFFLARAFLAGACTASFYGWLPLYLPELFPTRVRATGQGFSYNFGRVLAAVGVLQMSNVFEGRYPLACSAVSLVYLVGLALVIPSPETRGQPLPD